MPCNNKIGHNYSKQEYAHTTYFKSIKKLTLVAFAFWLFVMQLKNHADMNRMTKCRLNCNNKSFLPQLLLPGTTLYTHWQYYHLFMATGNTKLYKLSTPLLLHDQYHYNKWHKNIDIIWPTVVNYWISCYESQKGSDPPFSPPIQTSEGYVRTSIWPTVN